GLQVGERASRTVLDELTCTCGRVGPGRARAEAPFDRDGRQTVAEQLGTLPAGRVVAGDEKDGTAPRPAQRRVDPGLAHERVVEPEVLVVASGDGVIHDAVGRPRAGVHPDEERRITSLLEELRV